MVIKKLIFEDAENGIGMKIRLIDVKECKKDLLIIEDNTTKKESLEEPHNDS